MANANEALMLQMEIYERLLKDEANFKKTPKERLKLPYIETKLNNLEELWNDFRQGHKKIVTTASKSTKDTLQYFNEDVYEKCEEKYCTYKSLLKLAINNMTTPATSTHSEKLHTEKRVESAVKLPRIQLTTFSGKYEEWQEFYDMFLSLIHNNKEVPKVQKLHYLKNSITGEPAVLLRNFATTESNYDEAWQQLVKRYNNKRYNVNAAMKSFFTQKLITTETSSAVKQLLDHTTACLQVLENLEINIKEADAFVVYHVVSRLDTESHKQWEQKLSAMNADLPTWTHLKEFLEYRFRSLEMIEGSKHNTVKINTNKSNTIPKTSAKSFHAITQENKQAKPSCVLCNGQHYIYHCDTFKEKPVQERITLLKGKGLCFNCMCPNHRVPQCKQSTSCNICGRRHHTMLHLEDTMQNESTNNRESQTKIEAQPSTSTTETRIVANFSRGQLHPHNILLATATINAQATNGNKYVIRALLDQGSQASFVTESTVQLLGLKRTPINGVVSGLGDGHTHVKHFVSLRVESRYNENLTFEIKAYILGALPSLPTENLATSDWVELETLQLADPGYAKAGKIDILLGAEVYSEVLQNNMMKLPEGNLIAQQTAFGWILSGRVTTQSKSDTHMVSMHLQVRSDEFLKKFWELEAEPDLIKKRLTTEEEYCERYYNETTTRTGKGKFVVRLPFKTQEPRCQFGNTRQIAERKLHTLESRLAKDNHLRQEYRKVIEEYETLNHMELIPETELHNKHTYLPHHAVVREDKETTKVRVVMNASSKGTNGFSLNDDLLVGPKIQPDLRHLLMRWRTYPICIISDLVKMYRNVLVHKDDADFQRILWRSDVNSPIQHYRLITLTFGTASAPYLAVKTLQRLADEEGVQFPRAAEIARNSCYVDDIMTGCVTEDEAIHIYEELNKLMNSGGFQLQKWSSNSERLLRHIGEDKQSKETSVPIKSDNMMKVLGICWNRKTDCFEYTINLPEKITPVTKRQMLSDIARLYDPLGWIAPIVIRAKLLIQKTWKAQLQWDDELNTTLLEEWLTFRREILEIKTITIPRWQHCTPDCTLELHAFSDASTSAYAALVYLRVRDKEDNIYVSLVSAKTKVAPIERELSVPRLELCGAALAAKLLSEISQVMNIPKENTFAWTDSTIVLAWLKGGASKWTTFVSNRVSEILTILDYEQWGHVTTEMNPADCASRGLRPAELQTHTLWWTGPNWLYNTNMTRHNTNIPETQEEERIKTMNIIDKKEEDFEYTRFSQLNRMLRVLSYCKRVLDWKITRKQREHKTYITKEEMNNILEISIKQAQELEFGEEIKQLKNKGSVQKRSVLHNLCPILDKNGILRVGGRIEHSHLHYDERHPIIMPSKSHLTKLLIQDAHHTTLHGGIQLMLNHLRSKYWILRAREQVKKHYRNCITCRRYSKPSTQLMGQLPEVRLTPNKPFRATGVDFSGPINIRFSPGRGSKSYKGYICIFVCMATKAIHIEAVSDLTSKGFITAFRRFTSRRGHCQDLYSDNGTNFVGADKLLQNMFNNARSELPNEIAQALTLVHTTWHFIPPHAPNQGGLWEAGVRSIKGHLRKVIGDNTLTFEEISTLLTQVEACLNSRPISLLSDDPHDPRPLTPGHFLVGEPLINVTDESYTNCNVTNLERWRLIQKMLNDLWKRWSKEYLCTLHQRYKWFTKKPEPDIGDIVIIREDNTPPSTWLLGLITDKHVGLDGITRVVTIKTKNNFLKRPLSKV